LSTSRDDILIAYVRKVRLEVHDVRTVFGEQDDDYRNDSGGISPFVE